MKFIERLLRNRKMARKLRVGDKVKCCDGSYSFGIKQGKWNWNISNTSGDRENLRVVKLGLVVGSRRDILDFDECCDMLVTDGHGNFWFVQSCLCRLIPETHTITIDGKDIELSDESYQNLKRQLT